MCIADKVIFCLVPIRGKCKHLCFQGKGGAFFVTNLPTGALLLAYKDDLPAGCAGIRRIDDETAELKRMYVQDRCRRQGIGVRLLEWSLQKAKELGYEKIRLDTLQSMTAAQALYRSFGFYEIEPYRFNPLEGTIYMERKL